MPRCYQLVGVPGSGKSTWVANQIWVRDCAVVSTDAYVERFAQRMGKTYSEVFDLVMPRAVRLMMRAVRRARSAGQDVIWDQTSTTRASRSRKFKALRDYEHIAIVFATPPADELTKRLAGRPGKNIPWNVMTRMIVNFDTPDEDEGFAEIWYAS